MAKEVSHMRIECADNGGYVVETHFNPPTNTGKGGYSGSGYIEPETNVFGKGEEPALHKHIHETLPMSGSYKEGDTDSKGKKKSGNLNNEVESKTFERKEKKIGEEKE